MADRRELCVGGKPISSLRVVDLKVELEKRSLPKSGSKKDLLERLRLHLQLEENREAALRDEEHVPNLSLCNETENDFIREYLAAQQARFQVQREAKKQFEEKRRESEASAEETTQDEDEASDVSPTKRSPRKAMKPKKNQESTSTPKAQKSALDFQTPDSMPYSTPPQDKRDEDTASHDDESEEEEARAHPRKHKLLRYVQQPAGSKGMHPGKPDTGQHTAADHLEANRSSGRRDPPPSSLYGEAINLKVEGKKETSPIKKDVSPVKKEPSPSKKEPSPVKKEERQLRGQKTQPIRVLPVEESKTEEVFPRLVDVWSEKEREETAALNKLVSETPETSSEKTVEPSEKEDSRKSSEGSTSKTLVKGEAAEKSVAEAKVPATVVESSPEKATTPVPIADSPIKLKRGFDKTTPVAETLKAEVQEPQITKVEECNVEQKLELNTAEATPANQASTSLTEEVKIEDAKEPVPVTSVKSEEVGVTDTVVDVSQQVTEIKAESPVKINDKQVELSQEDGNSSEVKRENLDAIEPKKADPPAKKDESKAVASEDNASHVSTEKTTGTMAVENESPALITPDVLDKQIVKPEPIPQEVQPAEDNEEDELQMDTTEVMEDTLKVGGGETDDNTDASEHQTRISRSSSRSPSSSPEVNRSRNGRSSSLAENLEKQNELPQSEAKGETVRKWKIRKQQPTTEGDAGETGVTRKRRWGTSQLLPTKKPALVISTDSLKTLVPDAKPLSAEEVRLGSPNFQTSAKPSVAQVQESEEQSTPEKPEKMEVVRRVAVEVAAEALVPAKPEVVLAAAAPLLEATSPARQPRSSVLNVTNLVRPFTINQLKELLARTGHLIDGKFWIDKVKSTCLVQYETEEEAEETRAALHGIHWPTSNPKTLVVDYSTTEELENRLSGKEIMNPSVAKVEPTMRAAAAAVQSIEAKRDKAEKVREWHVGKTGEDGPEKEPTNKEVRAGGEEEEVKPKDEAPAKLLDDLFRKTKATPHVYWLPLTASQIAEKEEMRRQRLAERENRMREVQTRRDEEMQKREREREKQRENDRERQRARERDREKDRERERERQRSRKRSRASSSSSSSSTSSSPNKRRTSKTPPRKR